MRDQCTSSSRPPLLLLLLSFFYAGNRTSTQLAYGFSAAHDLARSKFWGRLVPKFFWLPFEHMYEILNIVQQQN